MHSYFIKTILSQSAQQSRSQSGATYPSVNSQLITVPKAVLVKEGPVKMTPQIGLLLITPQAVRRAHAPSITLPAIAAIQGINTSTSTPQMDQSTCYPSVPGFIVSPIYSRIT